MHWKNGKPNKVGIKDEQKKKKRKLRALSMNKNLTVKFLIVLPD